MPRVQCAFTLMFILLGNFHHVFQAPDTKREAQEVPSRIVGVWRGHSECAVKNSPCHDEVNVYRFAKIEGRPNAFSVTASKIVDAKEVVMGSSEWKYDENKHVLECERPSIRLTVTADKMEGALTLEDGTVYRRIYLKKES